MQTNALPTELPLFLPQCYSVEEKYRAGFEPATLGNEVSQIYGTDYDRKQGDIQSDL